jgi:hypothetical protein
MNRAIKTYTYPDGEIQRVETVRGFTWDDLSFVTPPFAPSVIKALARLYRDYIIPKHPESYGTLVFFHIPEGSLFTLQPSHNVVLYDTQIQAKALFQTHLQTSEFQFQEQILQNAWEDLRTRGLIEVVSGTGSGLSFLPVSGKIGFLSDISYGEVPVVNASFFLMDFSDCDSPYDVLGTPYGLMHHNGITLSPPLFGREALGVGQDGRVRIFHPTLRDVTVEIDGKRYHDGNGCTFHGRPAERTTPPSFGSDWVIVGNRVVAIHDGGETPIPMAGFVLSFPEKRRVVAQTVQYHGFEQLRFGIQVGPALLTDGVQADKLVCPFFQPGGVVPFPPTVYPLSFENGRAARIGLGCDANDSPVLVWVEGAGKLGHVKGKESAGASLAEFAAIGSELGLRQLVNLDGGGSAQIIHDGARKLRVADRVPGQNTEAERPVPNGLRVGGEVW